MKIKKHHRNLLLAMALGDGYISKTKRYSHSPSLKIEHGEKQKEYLEWKVSLLPKIWQNEVKEKKRNYTHKGVSSILTSYYHDTPYIKQLRLLRRVLYGKDRNKKIITPKMLERIGEFGMMIWYMDDGYLRDGGVGRGYRLRLCTFQAKEDNQKLIDFIKAKYNIHFYQSKTKSGYILECASLNSKKFIALFDNFDKPECMKYKFDVVESRYDRNDAYNRKRALLERGEEIV